MANGLGRRLAGAVLQGAGAGILQQAQQRRQDTLLRIRRQWQKEDRAENRAWAVEDRQASEALTREGWDRADTRAERGRDWAVEDREAGADLTREGWDRADARSGQTLIPAIDPETGSTVYMSPTDAAGKQVPGKKTGGRKIVEGADGFKYFADTGERVLPGVTKAEEEDKLIKGGQDPLTGEITYELESDVRARIKGQGDAPPSPEEEKALMDRASAARKNLGPSWTETDYWNPAVGSEEWLGVGDEEFDQRLAMLIKQNPSVPDDELARQLATELTANRQGGEGEGEGTGQDQGGAMAGEPQPPAGYPANARQAPDGKWYVPDPNSPSGWSLFTP